MLLGAKIDQAQPSSTRSRPAGVVRRLQTQDLENGSSVRSEVRRSSDVMKDLRQQCRRGQRWRRAAQPRGDK